MLEVTQLRSGYGAINVLWDVNIVVPQGKLVAIIGANGAGKTTLLRTIMGLLPIASGDIQLNGQSLKGRATWTMPDWGVAMIPEGRMIFKELNIEENLIMGAFAPQHRARMNDNLDQVYELFPRLKERRKQFAGSLSGGEAQMLAMARGLMSDPKLLIIDEPSLGLAPVIVDALFDILAQLKQQGRTIVLVEQNTNRAVAIADHVYLMQSGKIVLSEAAHKVDLVALHDLYFAR